MTLPIPQTGRRQYRRTALVIWPTSCRYDVSCHTTSPASGGQWGRDLPDGVMGLLKDIASSSVSDVVPSVMVGCFRLLYSGMTKAIKESYV